MPKSRARARRWSGTRLERDAVLRQSVLDGLDAGHRVISYETIYRFIYAQLRRTNDGAWRLYLPRAKFKRGW